MRISVALRSARSLTTTYHVCPLRRKIEVNLQ